MVLISFTGAPHGGRQRHLPEWQSQPPITPITIINHSIVGTGEQGYQYFLNSSSLEAHFIVENDGEIWQLMDTSREADANLDANAYAISIETGDRGDPDNQPWTAAQLDSLAWLHGELRRVHPTIPKRESVSCSGPAGLGYHTLHGAPSCWTPVSKTCPGRIRKQQWRDILLPAYLDSDTGGFLMSLTASQQAEVLAAARQVNQAVGFGQLNYQGTIEAILGGVQRLTNDLAALRQDLTVFGSTGLEQTVEAFAQRQRDMLVKLDELLARIPPPPAP
jgi:N-acetylmuramoyl-L-alanine amidase